jgi:phosphoglycolate phosphatase
MKKVIIFDFDGTIVDSMNAFADIAQVVLNKFFGTPIGEARQQYFATSGLPFFQQVELLHPGDPKNKAAADEYEGAKEKNYLSHRLFDDVRPALEQLSKLGIKTVVSSNNFQELVDKLVVKLNLKFDMVLGFRDGFAKGRDHFEHARRAFGAKLDEMAFVGDSLKDVDRGLDYGIEFIGKSGTFTAEDFRRYNPKVKVVGSLTELTKVL